VDLDVGTAIQLATSILTLGIVYGITKTQIKNIQKDLKTHVGYIKEDISRLEKKQDKHNSLIERVYKMEGIMSGLLHEDSDHDQIL